MYIHVPEKVNKIWFLRQQVLCFFINCLFNGTICCLLKPFLVLGAGESVGNDSRALMFPEPQSHGDILDSILIDVQHPLPDAREVTKVEDVMEFCRCGKHLDLGHLPEVSGGVD